MISCKSWCWRIALLTMALSHSQQLPAQAADSIVAQIMRDARRSGNAGRVQRVLGQQDRTYNVATLDALGDSMISWALRAESAGELAGVARQMSAISALGWSGSAGVRIPYAGAGPRLFLVAQQAENFGIRGAAISRIKGLADTATSIQLLRRIAVSDNPLAVEAVRGLWEVPPATGGLAVLRELAASGAITQPLARREVDRVARKYGWR